MDKNGAWATFDRAVIDGKATWWEMQLPEGTVTFGDAKAQMLGRKSEEFKTYVDFTDLLHPDDHDVAMQAMRDHLEGRKDVYECVYRIQHVDGNYIRFYDCGKVIKHEGEHITVMGFVRKLEDDMDAAEQQTAFRDIVLNEEPSLIDTVSRLKA